MATSIIKDPQIRSLWLNRYTFPQANSSHTITFSGKVTCRSLYGFVCPVGQGGLAIPIPFFFKGGAVAFTDITGVEVVDPNNNIVTADGFTITINTVGSSWGTISLIFLYNEPTLSWTWP